MVEVCLVIVANFKRFRWHVGDTKPYLDVFYVHLCTMLPNPGRSIRPSGTGKCYYFMAESLQSAFWQVLPGVGTVS